jgi:antitoxin VapB
MNAPAGFRSEKRASVFKTNRNQAVRLPKDFAFPDSVKQVYVRKEGTSLVLTPVDDFWDRFFDEGPNPGFPERFPQGNFEEREPL